MLGYYVSMYWQDFGNRTQRYSFWRQTILAMLQSVHVRPADDCAQLVAHCPMPAGKRLTKENKRLKIDVCLAEKVSVGLIYQRHHVPVLCQLISLCKIA